MQITNTTSVTPVGNYPADKPAPVAPVPAVTPIKNEAAPVGMPTGNKSKSSGISANTDLQISQDQDTKQIIVKVTNPETGEVLRQIPMEEYAETAKAIDKMISNFLTFSSP